MHLLEAQDAILHICGDPKSDKAANFVFYTTEEPFTITQTVVVEMKNDLAGMTAIDVRAKENQNENEILALTFPEKSDDHPCRLVKFTREAKESEVLSAEVKETEVVSDNRDDDDFFNDRADAWSDPPQFVDVQHPDKKRTQV